MDSFSLISGWVIGVLSPLALDHLRGLKKQKELKLAISEDLKSNILKMALLAHDLSKNKDSYTIELINWTKGIVEKYGNFSKHHPILPVIEQMSKKTDEEIKELLSVTESTINTVPALSYFNFVFIENNLALLATLDINTQRKLYKILNRVKSVNEYIKLSKDFFSKTFISDINQVNRDILTNNIAESSITTRDQLRILVDEIQEITDILFW